VSAYDHDAHELPRPTLVDRKPEPNPGYDRETVVDPHDNAALAIDDDGHVWVFVSGRGRNRPGRFYRSRDPYSVRAFERTKEQHRFAYPQPWHLDDGFLVCFTVYDETGNRQLHWQTSPDGDDWSDPKRLAGFGGHYQVSERRGDTVATAFNWHAGPDGNVDDRTNLYLVSTGDGGDSWTTVEGRRVDPPLSDPDNDALVVDYHSRDRTAYLNDITFDTDGNPLVLYVTSGGFEPGPENDPRRWLVTAWDGAGWRTHEITTSDHNYDSGSIYVRDGEWIVAGPTEAEPQPYHTGGTMAAWRSSDRGAHWERTHTFPARDGYNATYARRPRDATAPFEIYWADGDAAEFSDSRLYCATLDGSGYWRLPHDMDGETAEPIALSDPE